MVGQKGVNMNTINIDPTFSINDYNKPKMLTNLETYVNNILMLLFGRPGFYPSIPSIGMDISQYLYKFEDEISVTDIKNKLAIQCSDFLPEIDSGDFDVIKTTYNDRIILIFKLPIIDDTKECDIAIGVTTNSNGEIVYNFVESNKSNIL